MRRLLLFLTIYISPIFSNAQIDQSEQHFTIKEIGWIFIIPQGFVVVDSSAHTIQPNPGTDVWLKQFIFKSDSNSLAFTISKSTQKEVDWENIHRKTDKFYYDQMRIRKPEIKFDSSSAIVMLDSQIFNKFTVIGRENGVVKYNHVQLNRFFKGYTIGISYNYINKENGVVIENALIGAKFVE